MDKSRRTIMRGVAAGLGTLFFTGLAGAASGKPKSREKVIKVVAKKFEYSPSRIVLKKNQAVVLEITALDFAHGFKIPDWNIRADLIPGQVVKVRLMPDTAGEFDFLCDNFCGSGHEEMSGKIVVQG